MDDIKQHIEKPKKRIEYIDLMKGFCIIMVVLIHCKVDFPKNSLAWSMMEHLRMPLYYFLSGLFFKRYGGFVDFTVRKTNKLLIPYLFFSILYIIPDFLWLGNYTKMYDSGYYYWLVLAPLNAPLWFLKSLFVTGVLYYVFDKYLGKSHILIQLVAIFSMPYLAVWLHDICWPLIDKYKAIDLIYRARLFASMVAIPFFFAAHKVKKYLVGAEISTKNTIICLIVSFTIWLFSSEGQLNLNQMIFESTPLLLFVSGISGIFTIGCISKLIVRLPYVSYMGRYSIVVLCLHWPLMVTLEKYGIKNHYFDAGVILLVMPLLIMLSVKYLPYFTAQKDIFSWDCYKHKLVCNITKKENK